MTPAVSALFVYPVKSCRGVALATATIEARGVALDRRWMIVDPEGEFITQRAEPRLALVSVAVGADALTLSAAGRDPLALARSPDPTGPRRRVRVWRDAVDALDCGPAAARWITDWLGRPTSLVFMPDDVRRPVDPKYATAGDIVGFADGYPLLLVSTATLEDLNGRLDAPMPMNRFRPNVVVTGCEPGAEDGWRQVRMGTVSVRVVKPCSRCVVTTTDQDSAARGVEPLRTLATFRKRGSEVHFAQNCIPDGVGIVSVGDVVTADG